MPDLAARVNHWTRARARRAAAKPVLGVLAMLLVLAGNPAITAAQDARRFVWDAIDVSVELRPDASFHVSELDRVLFTGGPFREGYREIPLTRIERMSNIRVAEVAPNGLRPLRYVAPSAFSPATAHTYTVRTAGAKVRIAWSFPPTTSQARTFLLEYDAHGALRVYGDAPRPYQQITWIGVDRELTKDAQVNRASLMVILPRPVNREETFVQGPGGDRPQDHSEDGRVWLWEAANLGPGDSLQALLQFPPLVPASKPAWQDASDRQELPASPVPLLLLGLGLLIAIAGGLMVLDKWRAGGSLRGFGPVPAFLPAPPGDLPPGLAGALLDERVDRQDVVATLVDLGRRGVLRIEGHVGKRHEFVLTLRDPDVPLAPFEAALLVALFGATPRPNTRIALPNAYGRLHDASERIRALMHHELVERGYFPPPSRGRAAWTQAVTILLAAVLLGILFWGNALFANAPAIAAPASVLLGLGALVWVLRSSRPKQTRAGAAAAAQWRAFRHYLAAIDGFRELEAAQEIFERYLPYAIAFSLERSWVTAFARASTTTPAWFRSFDPSDLPRAGSRLSRSPAGLGTPRPTSGAGAPSPALSGLQGISNQAATSLQATSNSLFALFDAAGQSFPAGAGGGARSPRLSALGFGLRLFSGASGGGGGGFR